MRVHQNKPLIRHGSLYNSAKTCLLSRALIRRFPLYNSVKTWGGFPSKFSKRPQGLMTRAFSLTSALHDPHQTALLIGDCALAAHEDSATTRWYSVVCDVNISLGGIEISPSTCPKTQAILPRSSLQTVHNLQTLIPSGPLGRIILHYDSFDKRINTGSKLTLKRLCNSMVNQSNNSVNKAYRDFFF